MQLKWFVYSAGFCKLFSRFMARYPFSSVELRGQVHPKRIDLPKIRAKFLKIRVQRFRHLRLLLAYLIFSPKKMFGPVLVCA